MEHKELEPFGSALLAYHAGDTKAELFIRRDDGQEVPLPVTYFFRDRTEFTRIEQAALQLCRGDILDVGAGTGIHSLVLQEKGLSVTAIDINPDAVKIMTERRVLNVNCKDIFELQGRNFDTLLMLGHGIGMVGTLTGLDRFLIHAHNLLSPNGQIVLDSLDVRLTDNPLDLAYHQSNRQAGRYLGEIRIQFEFQEKRGPHCTWLHVDAETLSDHAQRTGWSCKVIHQEKSGDYLGQLTQQEAYLDSLK